MTDQRLRELERVAAAGAEALERRVRERLRAGRLDPVRLGLAALLGDPVARRVLGPEAPAPAEVTGDLVDALVLGDAAVQVRVAAAAARAALRVTAAAIPPTDLALAESAVLAAEAWVACPCEAHRAASLHHWCGHLDRRLVAPEVEAQLAAFMAAQVAGGKPGERGRLLGLALENAARALRPEELAGRIAPDLVPWALGEAEPQAPVKGG